MTKLHTLLGNGWSKIYSKVPTGYLQVTHHRKILNLDPQGSVATGELDPQVALPAGIPTGIPAPVSSPTLPLSSLISTHCCVVWCRVHSYGGGCC